MKNQEQIEEEMASLHLEIDNLHGSLERMGKNSKNEADIFGRRFAVPVSQEHKATADPLGTTLCNGSNPHMRAFHTSWFGFFSSFYSTFAAASLSAYIERDLSLTNEQWSDAGNAAVTGTILFRLAMGWICDKFGARRGLSYLLFGTIPFIVLMMFITEAWQFILLRCIIGFSLATFVACQTWCSQMFDKKVVGIANATAAGWGNLGGGITNLTMPLIFTMMLSFTDKNLSISDRENVAWRLCYIVPAILHLVSAIATLSGRDLPDGNFSQLENVGAKQATKSKVVLVTGYTNINAWIFFLTYGMCFGVELTMNNVAAKYFYRYHGLTPVTAGVAASMWGLMNLFARSIGGYLSDYCARKWGLRGRLWSCYIVQVLEGIMCILLGAVTIGMDAPHPHSVGNDKIAAWVNLGQDMTRKNTLMANGNYMPNGWVNLNATCYGQTSASLVISACDTLNLPLDDGLRNCLQLPPSSLSVIRQTAPPPLGPDYKCISNSDSIGQTMVLIVLFSLCVQAAEGLHFGIVPYISRPALGVVSGMVGAGGNCGAVIAGNIFFRGAFRTDAGIMGLGYMIIGLTSLMFFMYFPGTDPNTSGGMLFKPGGCSWYDPQIIKPPKDYTGADVMDYAEAKRRMSADTPKSVPAMIEVVPEATP